MLLVVVLGLGCGRGDAPRDERVPPAGDRSLRVVSLAVDASQFLVALGAGSLLVGVDAESRQLPTLQDVPVVDFSAASSLMPDLVLVPSAPRPEDPAVASLERIGASWVEFAPHDLQEVFALCRSVGGRLVGEARALRYETELSRPLAKIGGSSFGKPRLRVLPVVGFDPIEVAGGHSFETDLIEIAGATSVTHGSDEERRLIPAEEWSQFAPDVVLVVTGDETTADEQRSIRALLPQDYRVAFFHFDRERFWLREPAETARRLRALISQLGVLR